MTGEELKEIAYKNSKEIPVGEYTFKGLYFIPDFNWNAIAEATTPKPLTMEKLTMMLWDSAYLNQCVLRHEIIGTTAEGKFEIKKLLDLINNKQKEQS